MSKVGTSKFFFEKLSRNFADSQRKKDDAKDPVTRQQSKFFFLVTLYRLNHESKNFVSGYVTVVEPY